MSNLQVSSPMLDKADSGLLLSKIDAEELSMEVAYTDYLYMVEHLRLLPSAKIREEKGRIIHLQVFIEALESTAQIVMNEHRGSFWFNVKGNPISFLTGQNVLGSVNLPLLIVDFYKAVSRTISASIPDWAMPVAVRTQIKELNLCVTRLAFACYSSPLGLKDWKNFAQIINVIGAVYNYSNSTISECSLKQLLDLDISTPGRMSIRFDKMEITARQPFQLWSLSLYNKWQQLSDNGIGGPDELKQLVRFDLTLHSRWFNRKRLRNLADINRKFGSDYKGWVASLIAETLQETQLFYLLSCGNPYKCDVGDYGDEFTAWVKGEVEFSAACVSWFAEQGLNLGVSYIVHLLALTARASCDTKKEDVEDAMQGRLSDVGRKFLSSLADPKPMINVQRLLPQMRPDLAFPTYILQDGGYVDVSSGEVLQG